MKLLCVLALMFIISPGMSFATDLSSVPTEKLITDLGQIDTQAPGLDAMASFDGFIAEDRPFQLEVGVLGAPPPKVNPQMRELVRRGLAALPQLIHHLDDARPTKLTVGSSFFMFRYFSDEYQPRHRPARLPDGRYRPRKYLKRFFEGAYTVRIGDICYALIGQIVNRDLSAVRYQPTAGLVVNSPMEAPALIELVKSDWSDLDASAHKASLIADAQASTAAWIDDAALIRLRFYYPDEYEILKKGSLAKQITRFESDEKKLQESE